MELCFQMFHVIERKNMPHMTSSWRRSASAARSLTKKYLNVPYKPMRRALGAITLAIVLGVLSSYTFADNSFDIKGDPSGTEITQSLYAPNSSLPGWVSYTKPENPSPKEISTNLAHAFYSINFVWALVAAFLVMFMQAGFALLETGLVRAKNAVHTMAMNLLVYAVGITGFFICGFAFMCGGANGTPIGGPGGLGGIPVLNKMFSLKFMSTAWGLFGKTGFFLSGQNYDASALVWFIFMMVFMDTAATIPTGTLAERWKLKSFLVFSFFIAAFIYPLYGCWVWGGGWLAQLGSALGLGHGVVDYAGSSVVHLQGGAMAFILAKMLGARSDKYTEDGKPRTLAAHNIPMVVLGTFILAFGWFGFNAGSSLAGSDGRIGVIAVNTMLASASGALAALFLTWRRTEIPDVMMACNGMLSGLVAITAPCAFVAPWAAFLIGAFAGVIVVFAIPFIERKGIDDPAGAISVHGINGIWGVMALGLFADGTYGAGWNGVGATSYLGVAGRGVTGLLYGDSSQFFAQAIGSLVCIAWNILAAGSIFYVIGLVLKGNRVSEAAEAQGLDLAEMGGSAYPREEILAERQVSEKPVRGGSPFGLDRLPSPVPGTH